MRRSLRFLCNMPVLACLATPLIAQANLGLPTANVAFDAWKSAGTPASA